MCSVLAIPGPAHSSESEALKGEVSRGNLVGLGKAMSSDRIINDVKKAALEAGAFGCTISGAGRIMVAVTDDEDKGKEIGEEMVAAFMGEGELIALAMVKKLDRVGARLVSSI
ncbi:hypothetical protein L1987_58399 [Smallanthus sonchifolius]|uniref:Uncharacterized protein n=1 Tax=Smallanthus sonchifolius TaxID=185202 RepID=A0ACB9DFM8_9ASTR|nr:hypothetical protein L1987_58399 [Smallanthus sonchifolius]